MNLKNKIENELCFTKNDKYKLSSKKISTMNNEFIDLVKQETYYLNNFNPSTTDRLRYVLNKKHEINKCLFCNKEILNLNHKFCSHRCNNNSEETKNKFRKCYNNLSNEEKEIRIKKRTNTFNIRYGGYTLQVKTLRDKVEKKMFENFGVYHSFHSEEIKNKAKKTWLINYGVDNPFKSSEIINKIKDVLKSKYNVTSAVLINIDKNLEKTRRTKILRGLIIPDEFLTDFKIYYKMVKNLTRKNYIKYKQQINPQKLKRVTNGNEGYQLDHKYSIFEGFIDSIPIEIISHPSNLELITWKENIKKSKSSSILIEELKNNIENFNQIYHD